MFEDQDQDPERTFSLSAQEAVNLGNRLADEDEEADIWDIADGVLAGAIQYWLFAHQPCGELGCEDCEPFNTGEKRLDELLKLCEEIARESEYYHSPTDANVGNA